MIRSITRILILFFFTNPIFAQTSLEGKVTDEKNNNIKILVMELILRIIPIS